MFSDCTDFYESQLSALAEIYVDTYRSFSDKSLIFADTSRFNDLKQRFVNDNITAKLTENRGYSTTQFEIIREMVTYGMSESVINLLDYTFSIDEMQNFFTAYKNGSYEDLINLIADIKGTTRTDIEGQIEGGTYTPALPDFNTLEKTLYFQESEVESITYMYYNPDAYSGGQFVITEVSYKQIAEANKEYGDDFSGFFDFLDTTGEQRLIDIGSESFRTAIKKFYSGTEFAEGLNADIQHKLVELAVVPEIKLPEVRKIELIKVGDFYEVRGENAKTVADILDLVSTTRNINGSSVDTVGFPDFKLNDNTELLKTQGFTVNIKYEELAPFYEEHDELDDIDPAVIRQQLEDAGIVNGELVDEDKLNSDPFIQQVMAVAESDAGALNVSSEEIVNQFNSENEIVPINEPERTESVQKIIRPTITCDWSESPVFENGKTYSVSEFDTLMKNADDEWVEQRQFEIEEYGSENAVTEAYRNGELDNIHLGYEKTKFIINMPNGTKYTERQNIGDGNGGIIDFLNQYPQYSGVVKILEADIKLDKGENEKAADLPITESKEREVRSNEKLQSVDELTVEVENAAPSRAEKAEPPTLFDMVESSEQTETSVNDEKAKNYVIEDREAVTGAKTKFQNNIAAIKILKQTEAENRAATPEEQSQLFLYSGWGGLANAFESDNDKWKNEYSELKGLLTDEEYTAARSTVLDSFYTDTAIVDSIYEVIRNAGFEDGNILEPAMGVGNFFGRLPEELRDKVNLYGVEKDSLSGRIAQKLYPQADITIDGFENTRFNDNSFDVAIGNIPFGDFSVNDSKYNSKHLKIHDYFFLKSLDKVRDGGIVAFVTSKGTLDKKDSSFRKTLAERADLVGAVRLPNNAFKSAGTEVTADIIFLQKREKKSEIEPSWVHTGQLENGLTVNNYFVEHPEMVLGNIVEGNKMYGRTDDTMCVPFNDGRKLGLDPRLIDPSFDDDPGTKLNVCVNNVFDIYDKTSEKKLTQIIFCDLGVPGKNSSVDSKDDDIKSVAELDSLEESGKFCVYDDIRDKLIAKGVPADEIAYIHSAKTETQKSELFAKVRSGEVRILLGSTSKMGTGTNVQDKIIALHDLDVPWRPSDLEQRRGRMVRQGNINEKVHLYRYVTKGTFDAYSYQLLEKKQKFISQVMTSKAPGRKCADVDQAALTYSEIKALCTGDERIREKLTLENQVKELQALKSEYSSTKYELEDKVNAYPEARKKLLMDIGNVSKDLETVKSIPYNTKDGNYQVEITLGADTYSLRDEEARKAATKALTNAFAQVKGDANKNKRVNIGQLANFGIEVINDGYFFDKITATLRGNYAYSVELGVSNPVNLKKIENLLFKVENVLNDKKSELNKLDIDYKTAQNMLNKPFEFEDELNSSTKRLDELTTALNIEMSEQHKSADKPKKTHYFGKDFILGKKKSSKQIQNNEVMKSEPKRSEPEL